MTLKRRNKTGVERTQPAGGQVVQVLRMILPRVDETVIAGILIAAAIVCGIKFLR